MVATNKRFVAGAKCPKCEAMDSIMLYMEDGVEQLECVECGYHERRDEIKVQSAVPESDSVIGVFKPE